MRKTIEVTITLTSEDEFTLDFYEPESGDHCLIEGDDSYDGSLTDRVGSELLSWVDLMREEQEDEVDKKDNIEEGNGNGQYLILTETEAMADVINYLNEQPSNYFAARSTTLKELMENGFALGSIVDEHMRCVNRYGCEREWSCQDACDNDPGFYPEID